MRFFWALFTVIAIGTGAVKAYDYVAHRVAEGELAHKQQLAGRVNQSM
jgi:hypothetical protein